MSDILVIVPSRYTKVDTDVLTSQCGVDVARLSQASRDHWLNDINDMLHAGGFFDAEKNVMEVLEAPNGEYFLRIE